ncbi:MAG: NUDIX domain-containing protein [Cyanobacteriota bacterium]
MSEQKSKEYNVQDDPIIEKPSVTVDIVIFTIQDNDLQVLLIKRKTPPFKDSWAIPGGFIHVNETLEDAALRELKEETGVGDVYLEQLYSFGNPNRDPRKRVITVAYYSLVASEKLQPKAGADAEDVNWFSIHNLPDLGFDHSEIIDSAIERVRTRLAYTHIGFQLLPQEFTLTELQRVYEIIIDKKLDKRNFRKRVLSMGILEETNKTKMEGYHRPAKLYSFKSD